MQNTYGTREQQPSTRQAWLAETNLTNLTNLRPTLMTRLVSVFWVKCLVRGLLVV